MATADTWIKRLELAAHPEGGYFKEVYRATESVHSDALPERYQGSRQLGTSIYFLLTSASFSAFHKVNSDEGWHYYTGDAPIRLYEIAPNGTLAIINLGSKYEAGERFQYTVAANHWFAAEVMGNNAFGLVGCTVSPGFDFADFTLANRTNLVEIFPQHQDLITRLTRA